MVRPTADLALRRDTAERASALASERGWAEVLFLAELVLKEVQGAAPE